MTAIAGVWDWRGQVDRDLPGRMLPDTGDSATGFTSSVSTALAHQSPDIPGALLGFPFVDGQRSVNACGRIDNLPALRAALGLPPSASPAQVLLGAHARWGHDMAQRVLGDFAIAVRDDREDTLFLARDRFGAVPLFWTQGSWGVAFATSSRALLRVPGVSRAPDDARVAAYLADLPFDPASSFHRGIRAVPAAHSITIQKSSTRASRYWRLDPDPEVVLGDDQEYASEFRARLVRAVDRCTAGAASAAVTLSGGLDSSSVACTAGRLLGRSVASFTAVFPDLPSCDERTYVEQVVAAARATPTYTDITAGAAPHPWELAASADEPVVLGWYPLFLRESAAARRRGHRFLLTGSLGDAVGGSSVGCLPELVARRDFSSLTEELRRMPLREAGRTLAGLSGQALLPGTFRAVNSWRMRLQIKDRFPGLRHVARALSRRHALEDVAAGQLCRTPGRSSRHELARVLESNWPAGELGMIRWCAAQNGVIARHPFADAELVEWVVRLPLHIRRRHGLSRWVLREAMDGVVPDAVRLRRTKTLFDSFYERQIPMWLEHLREMDWAPADPFLDRRAIAEALRAPPQSYRELRAVWTCATLLLWLRSREG